MSNRKKDTIYIELSLKNRAGSCPKCGSIAYKFAHITIKNWPEGLRDVPCTRDIYPTCDCIPDFWYT